MAKKNEAPQLGLVAVALWLGLGVLLLAALAMIGAFALGRPDLAVTAFGYVLGVGGGVSLAGLVGAIVSARRRQP